MPKEELVVNFRKQTIKELRQFAGVTETDIRASLQRFANNRLAAFNAQQTAFIPPVANRIESSEVAFQRREIRPAQDGIQPGNGNTPVLGPEEVYVVNDGELQVHSINGQYARTVSL